MTGTPGNTPPLPSRMTEDLRFVPVDTGEDYAREASGSVQYVAVANGRSGLIGYLWVADADGAAGWKPRPAAGEDAYNGSMAWIRRLREAKARGLVPSRALEELALAPPPEDPVAGGVVDGSLAQVPDLAALTELAAS